MCTIPNQGNDGIEAYGIGHGFYNNEVEQNSSYGMIVGTLGANATEQITISSSNPYDNTDTPRYIESNQGHGIYFSGPPQISYMEQGVLLNDVLVQNNTGWGVYLTEVQNSSGYSGFANNSCISNNSAGTVTYPRPPTNSLTSPTPGSYSNYHGMPCPTSGLPQQIPSPSPIGSTWIW
jgi:hypothetical protein